jgi:DNA replication protein DnaC
MQTTTSAIDAKFPAPGPEAVDLDGLLRRLHLPTIRRLYPELENRAEVEGMSYRDYLAVLVSEEVAHRAGTRIQRATRKARFPFLRTIEEFDFKLQTAMRLSLLGSYLGPELIDELSTNKPLNQWGRVLHDADLAEAITDRVLERGRFIQLRGPSYRTRHLQGAEKEGK